jgi:hypothetical protein
MEFIHKNPFRILGLPVTASEREISKRVSDLEMYLEMGKPVYYDMDFPALSPIERSLESVSQAVNQIESDKSRLYYSTFWFWNNNTTDELALDVLKEGKIDTAIRLMEKLLSSGNGEEKSFSTAKNLSVLYMALSFKNNSFLLDKFSSSLKFANIIFNDKYFSMFADQIPGRLSLVEKNAVIEFFVDDISKHITPFLNKEKGVSLKQLIASFSFISEETRNKVANRFISVHLQTIENAIKLSENERKSSPETAHITAKKLFDSVRHPLASIQDAVGKEDYVFQAISDKLAIEIDYCSTEYYNYHFRHETGIDPGEVSLKISKYARTLATSLASRKKIDEGIEIVERWNANKEEREKQKKVGSSFVYIADQINNIPDIDDFDPDNYMFFVKEAMSLLENCKPHLDKIKTVLGQNNDTFINYSSAVVNNAMNLCIEYANREKDSKTVLRIFEKMATFFMDSSTHERYTTNKNIFTQNVMVSESLDSIHNALNRVPKPESIGAGQINQVLDIAQNLINSTAQYLRKLKSIDANLYIGVSSTVANVALTLCIIYANQTGKMSGPLKIIDILEKMDMDNETRKRLRDNKLIINSNINRSNTNYDVTSAIVVSSESHSSKKSSGPCYIATMVYGDYNSPKVVILRRFRDDVLYKSRLGIFLVKIYYAISPSFVKHFGKYMCLHRPIKYFLDYIVRRVA